MIMWIRTCVFMSGKGNESVSEIVEAEMVNMYGLCQRIRKEVSVASFRVMPRAFPLHADYRWGLSALPPNRERGGRMHISILIVSKCDHTLLRAKEEMMQGSWPTLLPCFRRNKAFTYFHVRNV
jgi:hypothetical protein